MIIRVKFYYCTLLSVIAIRTLITAPILGQTVQVAVVMCVHVPASSTCGALVTVYPHYCDC